MFAKEINACMKGETVAKCSLAKWRLATILALVIPILVWSLVGIIIGFAGLHCLPKLKEA
jgi:hypothetical protein